MDGSDNICNIFFSGLSIPESYEGMDLSRHITSGGGEEPEAALLQGMGHTFQWHDGDEWRAVRNKRYTYGYMLADDSEYLFDNVEGPYQMNNLINDSAYQADKNRLKDFMHHKMMSGRIPTSRRPGTKDDGSKILTATG